MHFTPDGARSFTSIASTSINVIGAGIAGTWQALLFAKAGRKVALYERDEPAMTGSTGYWAGGMLAPHCESEAAEPVITRLGLRSLDLWREALPDTPFNGSLVVAHGRDRADFERFTRLASGHKRIDADEIAALEPALAGRFAEALFFPAEGHVEPRRVLPALHEKLRAAGVPIEFKSSAEPRDLDGLVIDCRGLAARDACPTLRGVKGEIIVIETDEIKLSRPVRLIHPRWSLYIVPRAGQPLPYRRHLDRNRKRRRQRALGARTVDRGLCRAPGLRRSAHRRVRLGACAPPSPTICRASPSTTATATAASASTASTGTASC